MPCPPGDPLGGIAQRSSSDQSARIHRVERHVIADGRVNGGAHLGLVIDTSARHAAGEVDQRLCPDPP
jgi:hypothetical protein